MEFLHLVFVAVIQGVTLKYFGIDIKAPVKMWKQQSQNKRNLFKIPGFYTMWGSVDFHVFTYVKSRWLLIFVSFSCASECITSENIYCSCSYRLNIFTTWRYYLCMWRITERIIFFILLTINFASQPFRDPATQHSTDMCVSALII